MKRTTHTHKGHCQICGRLQAVDNATGTIAAHGYKVPEHWHARTRSCHGAMGLPFEKSRDLIPAFIRMLEELAAKNDATAQEIRFEGTDADLSTGTPRVTIKRTPEGLRFRRWSYLDAWATHAGKKPEVIETLAPAEFFKGADPDSYAIRLYGKGAEALAVQHAFRAEQCRRDAKSWQERFDSWVADAPLTPMKKDAA